MSKRDATQLVGAETAPRPAPGDEALPRIARSAVGCESINCPDEQDRRRTFIRVMQSQMWRGFRAGDLRRVERRHRMQLAHSRPGRFWPQLAEPRPACDH